MIKRRRYGRKQGGPQSGVSTHSIKIGWTKNTKDNRNKRPSKLPGFLICRDSRGDDGKPIIDYDSMMKLGCDSASIDQAIQKEIKAVGKLPTKLDVALVANAERDKDGNWRFPGTFDEQYECWSKAGLFCYGDGETASRRDEEGGRFSLPCVPVGTERIDGESYCPYSVDGSCKSHMRFSCIVFYTDEKGRCHGLSSAFGQSARYRLDSTSEYISMRLYDELSRAANRLDGWISGITGSLVFSVQQRRTGNPSGHAVGDCGNIALILNETDIAARETEAWNRKIAAPRPYKQLVDDSGLEQDETEHTDAEHTDAEHEVITPDEPDGRNERYAKIQPFLTVFCEWAGVELPQYLSSIKPENLDEIERVLRQVTNDPESGFKDLLKERELI